MTFHEVWIRERIRAGGEALPGPALTRFSTTNPPRVKLSTNTGGRIGRAGFDDGSRAASQVRPVRRLSAVARFEPGARRLPVPAGNPTPRRALRLASGGRMRSDRLRLFRGSPERFDLGQFFPAESITPEMPVSCRFAINRAAQFEIFDQFRGLQREDIANHLVKQGAVDFTGTEGIHEHADRFRHTDSIGQLDFTLSCQACPDDVLGNVSGHVRG